MRRLVPFGQDSAALVGAFRVSLASSVPGGDELILVPRSRRVRRHLAEVRLALDGAALPRRVEYLAPGGARLAVEFAAIQVNEPLPAGLFVLRAPPGARVVRGTTSLTFGFDDVTGPEPSAPGGES